MPNSTEALTTAARTQLDTQLQLATSIAGSLIDGMEKVAGLNLQAAKASFNASIGNAQHLFAAKDPQEFFSLSAHQAQPHAEIALTYGRHLASIASGTQLELARVAEDQVNQSSRHMVNLLDEFGRLAPAGSEGAFSLMKSALDNVSASVGQLARNSKIAIETMEHNVKAACVQAGQSPTKNSRSKK